MITDEKLELSKLPIEEQRVIEEIKKQIHFPLLEFDDKEDDENKKHEKNLNTRSSYAITNNHVTHLSFIRKSDGQITLPKNFSDLSQLHCLILKNCEIKKIPGGVKELKIRELKIFRDIPEFTYSNLFWIKNYPLESLSLNMQPPEFIGDFSTLKIYNQQNLDEIPLGIGNLKDLREFTFLSQYGINIPNFLSNLSNLRKFHWASIGIDEIPEWFGEFAPLEDLSLEGFFYHETKKNLSKISTLKKLRLKNNSLGEIPEFIKNLPDLRNLELMYPINIPEWLGEFAPLETLNLKSPSIKDFNVINRITSLKKLIVGSIQIPKPLNFDNLDKLESLKIYFPNSNLNFSVSDSSSIKKLDLAGNKIKKLPNEIKKMIKLEKLNLFSSDLKTLPFWISKLSKLEDLNLMSNQLTEIPMAIKNLKSLKKLNLSGNKIKKIPNWIENLNNLKILDIGFNNIEKINPSLCNLLNLEHLSIAYNQIKSLPDSLKRLINLRYFYFDSELYDTESFNPDILENIYSPDYPQIDLKYRSFPRALYKYVYQYHDDPDSLSDEEKNYLVYKSGLLEKYLLESKLPSTDPILRRITKRIESELFWKNPIPFGQFKRLFF